MTATGPARGRWAGSTPENLPVSDSENIFNISKSSLLSIWCWKHADYGFLFKKNSFVYTSGHCHRWRSRMEVKIMSGSLFVHCKIAYIYSVTAEKWLIESLSNFVTIRRTHFSISCKIFSWIRSTKLKIHAMEFCDFIKDSVRPSGLFVPCSLTVTSTWRPRLTAHTCQSQSGVPQVPLSCYKVLTQQKK